MIAITYNLTLLEPLLATRLEGDPNSGRSFSYVTGGMIRGALSAAYLRDRKLGDAAADADFRRLFLDGTTRYLHAYPMPKSERMLPTPRSWFVDKGDETPIYDFSVEEQPEKMKRAEKWAQGEFCTLSDTSITPYTPPRQMKVHTQRNRRKGRATKADGAVFQYEALERGEKFGGVILVDCDADADTIKQLLQDNAELKIGRSATAGYGLVAIDSIQCKDSWREIKISQNSIAAGDKIRVTLVSDAIVRDGNGQYSSEIIDAVRRVEGWETIEQKGAFKGTTIVGGFNRKWGLPLPQTLAISTGSVFVFTAKADITPEAIARLELQGLGERRAEGFGRVVVNWHKEEQWKNLVEVGDKEPLTWRGQLNPESKELVEQMATRMLRRQLDRALAKRVQEKVQEINLANLPQNSQLSRLRLGLRDAMRGEVKPKGILDYFGRMKKTARDQFAHARLDGRNLDVWVCEIVKGMQQDAQGTFRNKVGAAYQPVNIGDHRAELTEALAREYMLRFIDGVLAQAMKKRNQEGK